MCDSFRIMTETNRRSGGGWSVVAGVFLVLSSGTFGLLAGGFLGTRAFITESGMGWDRLADALGGVMVGGALGLALGAFLLIPIRGGGRWWAGLLALALGALVVLLLRLIPPPSLGGTGPSPDSGAAAAEPKEGG